MPETTPWRELHRTSDSQELLAIVTSIAAMEFETRCVDCAGRPVALSELDGPGPYIVQVPADDHAELLDVLDEIIAEQDEFDADLRRRTWTGRQVMVSCLCFVGIIIVLLMALAVPR